MGKITQIGKEYYDELKKISEGGSESSYFKKALTFDDANSGSEFLPEPTSAEIITQVYEREWHRQTIPSFVMNSLKEKIPKFTDKAVAKYLASDITSFDATDQIARSSRATDEVEIELKTLTMNLPVSNKFLAYNASPQVENIIRETLISEMIESEVDVLINGDTAGTHQDSDVTDADDRRKAFSGLRKLTPAGNKIDHENKIFTIAAVNKMIEKGARFFRGRIENLIHLVPPSVARQLRDSTQLQTLDKYGPQATVLTGEIGKANGVTTIETDLIREDLNASGVHDGATEDRTITIMFNPQFLYWGVPANADRTLNLKVWDDPRFDRKQLILVEDIGFVAQHDGTIVQTINIDVDGSSES